MTNQSEPNDKSSFPAFAFGLTLGVIGVLAFGTEEGRKVVKKLIDSIPDKYKAPPVTTAPFVPKVPIIPMEETQHHSTYQFHSGRIASEPPPPPAPDVRPTRPEPFHPNI